MQNSGQPKSTAGPIVILGALFFIFGFVTWLNGTLIPYLKIACELKTSLEAFLVTFAFYISYFFTALPMSRVLRKTGYKRGMMIGLMVMAIGALVFVPAAITRTYLLFLIGLFIIGTGLSLLQTASNPYITILGNLESAAARISIMGICNKVAGFLAPIILGALVLSDADQLTKELQTLQGVERAVRLDELAHRVILPYIGMAGILVALSLFVRYSSLPELGDVGDDGMNSVAQSKTKTSVLSYPNLILGVIAIFVYVGVEVISVDTIALYGQSQAMPLSIARYLPSYTLFFMVIGYVIGIFTIPRFIKQEKALLVSAIAGIILSMVILFIQGNIGIFVSDIAFSHFLPAIQFTHGSISIFIVALLGLANALMWPAIWPLAIDGLGRFTKIGSALLIMGIAGGALIPPLWGRLADISSIGHQKAYWILIPCYLYILYYSLRGHKMKHW